MAQDQSAGRILSLLRLLRPHRIEGVRKVRLGRLFDGGYVMLDLFEGVEAAYSLGINDDVSWDMDIANRGIPLFMYDHTIESLPSAHSLFNWKKIGIGTRPDPDQHIDTLTGLMRSNGHGDARDLLLKCDIEGAEWDVLAEIPNPMLRKFKQIVIEVHWLDRITDDDFAERVRRALTNLTSAHRVVHVHGNNHGQWFVYGGVPLPVTLELTLVRADEGRFTISDETFPTPLDMPCHSGRPDYYLGRFAFD